MEVEWTLTLRQVFQDVQLQAVEASSYLRNASGVTHQRTLIPAVRRLNALFSDEVQDGKRTVVEEAFVLFLNEMWLAVARVLVAPKVSDVVLLAIASLVGDFLRRSSSKSKELTGKAELRLEVLKRLMDATKADDRGVRLRACRMLQIIVNRLEFIEKELVEQLKETLLARLKDKVTSVRIQSIYGLKRFQDADGHDTIARELNALMVADPSKDVRKAALITLIPSTFDHDELLVRIRDASEDVRVAAFGTIAKAVAFNDLALKDRVHLLDQGLHDRSLRVRRACEQMVVTRWLPACDSSPLLLLKALAIADHPAIGSKVARLVIHHVATQSRSGGPKKGDLNALELMSKTSDAFTLESVFFWREQCLYYQKIDKDMDQVAALVPNVSEFSNMLVATCKAETNVLDIAQQLLELGHLLDLQDEVGRRNLLDALQNLLRDLETESQLIKGIMELLAFIYSSSSEQEFIQVVAEIVSDMYDAVETDGAALQHEDSSSAIDFGPQVHKLSDEDREAAEVKLEELEKQLETLESESEDYTKVQTEMAALELLLQDPRVVSWLRCLEIVAQLLKLTSHNLSDPIVDGMGRYILPAIDSDVPALREAGLENLGLYCLLDKRLAERYLVVFWRALNNPEEEREVKHTCVQAIMDMAFSFTKLQPHIFGTPQVKADPIDEALSVERNQENKAPNQGEQEKHSDREVKQKHELEANGSVEKLDLDSIFIGLGQLVSVDDVDLQSTIVEGFCRLFMMNRIDNITVLALLLETYFCPELQKVQRQRAHGFQSRSLQVLSLFFSAFVLATSANALRLEEAATHLMQKSMEKVESDAVFDLPACAKYVLQLLRQPAHEKSDEKPSLGSENRSSAHHNRMGISMCLEVLALANVAAVPLIRSELVTRRQKTLVKMLAYVDVTVAEPRSAALFQHLLQAIASTCFASQKGLLRSVDAMVKRTTGTIAALHEADVARAQDQAWAHELVQERASVLAKVLVEASQEVEKSLKKQEREKKRRTSRLAASASESESESDEEDAVRTLRRHVSARRSKTAAVSRMQEKAGEFDAKIQRALDQDRRTSESEEMSESEGESESEDASEEESEGEEESE